MEHNIKVDVVELRHECGSGWNWLTIMVTCALVFASSAPLGSTAMIYREVAILNLDLQSSHHDGGASALTERR